MEMREKIKNGYKAFLRQKRMEEGIHGIIHRWRFKSNRIDRFLASVFAKKHRKQIDIELKAEKAAFDASTPMVGVTLPFQPDQAAIDTYVSSFKWCVLIMQR